MISFSPSRRRRRCSFTQLAKFRCQRKWRLVRTRLQDDDERPRSGLLDDGNFPSGCHGKTTKPVLERTTHSEALRASIKNIQDTIGPTPCPRTEPNCFLWRTCHSVCPARVHFRKLRAGIICLEMWRGKNLDLWARRERGLRKFYELAFQRTHSLLRPNEDVIPRTRNLIKNQKRVFLGRDVCIGSGRGVPIYYDRKLMAVYVYIIFHLRRFWIMNSLNYFTISLKNPIKRFEKYKNIRRLQSCNLSELRKVDWNTINKTNLE